METILQHPVAQHGFNALDVNLDENDEELIANVAPSNRQPHRAFSTL
jgi:hypothetical protein